MLIVLAKPSQSKNDGWENLNGIYQITFKNLLFKVDANLAGRIISFQLNEQEILGQPDLHPEMFGSSFWPAPQSDWGWPPYPVLDKEPYQAELIKDTLILTSEKCRQSGLQFVKKFIHQKKKNRIRIEYYIRNVSDTVINVAPWEVTRVPSFGLTFFPLGESLPQEKSTLQNVEIENGLVWYYSNTDNFSEGQKMFVSGSEGWLAYCKNNLLFLKVFPDIKEGECAPGQGEIEVFAFGEYNYVELENHGKIETLQPGQNLFYPVYWVLKKLREGVKTDSKNLQLPQEVRKIIQDDF